MITTQTIMPTTTTGATTRSRMMSGFRLIHSCERSRIRKLCTSPDRRMCAPMSFRSAAA